MNKTAKILLFVTVIVVVVLLGGRLFIKPEADASGPVHLRLQSFALSLNPLKMADVESRQVATLLYAGLIVQNQDGTTQPAVAEKWKQNGNEWEFTLKSGLTFSNGQPLHAQDVVTSLCNAMQPTSPWAWALESIQHTASADGKKVECTGINIVDEHTVRLVQARAVPWFLDAIGGPAGWIMPAAETKEGAYGVMPSLGPYTIKEFVPDNKVVLEPRSTGSAIAPGTTGIQFDYIADDAVAVSAFTEGKLHVLDLTSPKLVELLVDAGSGKLKVSGNLAQREWDRVRIAIINEKSLLAKGFDAAQAHRFIQAYSVAVDRNKIAQNTRGIGTALESGFPPVPRPVTSTPVSNEGFPKVNLTVITESDAYSDLIAASLPKTVGAVTIDYRGVDKGVLIQSLIKSDFDIASILIEATTHSPEFWKSFFTPGNPYTAFGKPVAGLENVQVNNVDGVQRAAELISQDGNWVGILQEKRFQAIAPGISGVSYSPSGQTNYAFIKH